MTESGAFALNEQVLNGIIEELEHGHTSEALATLEQLEKTGTDEDRLAVADLYIELGLSDRAVNLLAPLYVEYAGNAGVALLLAECYIDLDREEEAISVLEQVDTTDMEYGPRSLVLLADLYQSQGLDEVALAKLKEARNLAPEEPLLAYGLAELYMTLGAFDQAVPLFAEIAERPELRAELPLDALYAESLAMTGQFEDAIPLYERAVAERSDLHTLFGLAMTAHRVGQHQKAVETFQQLIAQDPDYTSAYVPYAESQAELGLTKEALNVIKQGMERDDYNDELRTMEALFLLKLGDRAGSVQALREALALNPESIVAAERLLSLLAEDEDHEAMIETISAIEEHVTAPILTWYRARALYALEEYTQAMENYAIVEGAFTEDALFLKEYGFALVEEGRREEGQRLLRRAAQLTPEDNELVDYVERMDG
ncbi:MULTISPECIES: tetratricopeptide repeat protein [Exiguobacterium]|jgi:tetratricopeptide (TPR) repeat protein|uniref:tetratricopeptide repeat protein n=4 Tax=Bacillales Family XII. Incertae Sedis TaxID=539742 RepID=UPI00044D8AA3|nr:MULTISPECIES: tetratricopeptide repeat protein [Exiguobacterium]EZP60911.1 Tetratricopeptide repeat protein [Exiguobacterium sp. RIT341]MDQ6467058.1 tetratricopeptide repeat protein [Exiguobacterium acetylicum]